MNLKLATAALLFLFVGCSPSPSRKACDNFDIQGHRGARGYLPENSIPGFILALEQGATTLEMDVVVTGDAELVLSHEPWFNPDICTDAKGNELDEHAPLNIFEMDMNAIRSCDCGSKGNPAFPSQKPMPIAKPALWEVISVTEKLRTKGDSALPRYNIELKFKDEWVDHYHPNAERFASLVIGELRELGIFDRSCLQSFSQTALEAIHKIAPDICTTWLIEEDEDVEDHTRVLSFTPTIISPHFEGVTASEIDLVHATGSKIIPWTVNTQTEMERLVELGVDGLITDYPDLLYEEIQKRKSS